MHVHLPKPIHGWREFVGEVGIIVLGILIALGAEALIERWHWHEQAEHARETFKDDLYIASINAWERLAIQPCLQGSLDKLLAQVVDDKGAWAAMPMRLSRVEQSRWPTPYRVPTRLFPGDGWRNALASGILNHIPASQVADFSRIYSSVNDLAKGQESEAVAVAKIAPLAFRGTLNNHNRADMIANLALVNEDGIFMNIVSRQLLDDVRDLHLHFDAQRVETTRRELLLGQRGFRGPCVRDLPLNLN